jgi:SAM-dependent methyltransferase
MAHAESPMQFGSKLLGMYTGAMLTKLIDIGYQTGLFDAASIGPATSEELSARAGLRERYVREWLGAMVTGGIFSFDAATGRYALPEEHARFLTGATAQNQSPHSRMINHFGTHIPKLVACFREGGGIPYSAYRPVFTECMDDVWRRIYDQHLLPGFIGVVEGISDKLKRGIRVLDIGCGTGHAMNLLALEFPLSTFVGYDIGADAIARARQEAAGMGLKNARFEEVDVTHLDGGEKFDLITAFDAIHDQKAPDSVLRSVNRSLAADGVFLMIEFKFSSRLEENLGNPFAPLYYATSLMHCMPVSLALGGAGLGTVWGEQAARKYLKEAGFGSVKMLDTPRPQNCIFVCRHQ